MNLSTLQEAVKYHRLVSLFSAPGAYWEEVEADPGDGQSILVPQLLLLAAVPAVCLFLGQLVRLVGTSVLLGIIAALVAGVLTYALQLALWAILGVIINFLADQFMARKDMVRSLKLSAGTLIPVWLGSSLQAVPFLGHILGPAGTLAGMAYGSYLLYLGLPTLNSTPVDKALVSTVATVAILFVLVMFLTWMSICPAGCIVTTGSLKAGAP